MEKYTNRENRLILNEIKTDIKEILKSFKWLNGRVRKLEQWKSFAVGAIVIIGMILTWIIPKVLNKL